MCGFVGGSFPSRNYEDALELLNHRGPDHSQSLCVDGIQLGFNRLAIQDLSERASQPMFSSDRKTVMLFNGEVYNFESLRNRLKGLGHSFFTGSDSEVVLASFEQWGIEFLEQIDGMFAIVLLDRSKRRLHLIRDRVGIKPLYYYWNGRHVVFASELKAIFETLGSRPTLRSDALYDFLTYQCIPSPKTAFQDVHQLRPAHRVEVDLTLQSVSPQQRYWSLSTESGAEDTAGEIGTKIRNELSKSVREQLVADVPTGVFLSAGIDSSLIAYEASRARESIKTFSMGFEGEKNEVPEAEIFAKVLGSDHRSFVLSSPEVKFQRLLGWFDEPFADLSAFPTHRISAEAVKHVRVVLSGDGGDELFGGYSWYQRYRNRSAVFSGLFRQIETQKNRFRHQSIVRRGLNFASYSIATSLAQFAKLTGRLTKQEKVPYAQAFEIPREYDDYWAWREFWRTDLPPRTRLQFLDFHRYLPDELLTKVDRVSMAESLEVRVPFLSRGMIELAFSIPDSERYRAGAKGILRDAYRGRVSDHVLDRVKSGFGIPQSYSSCYGAFRPAVLLADLFGCAIPKQFSVAEVLAKP